MEIQRDIFEFKHRYKYKLKTTDLGRHEYLFRISYFDEAKPW